jgi:hypothetical protein
MVGTPQLVMADIHPRSHAWVGYSYASTFPISSYRSALPINANPFS